MRPDLCTVHGAGSTRRRCLHALAAGGLAGVLPARAQPLGQQPVPIADMHSHYGLVRRALAGSGLAEAMRSQRVALVAWKLIADAPWIRLGASGIVQVGEPAPGEAAARFDATFVRMKAYVRDHGLQIVKTPSDVDDCMAGKPGIVLAAEGADFLEGRIARFDAAYDDGLRHLQLVHYIANPVGDFQTAKPVHDGLSAFGRNLVAACNAKGVLVDMAHATGAALDQAMDVARKPLVWSHGWVDRSGGHWRDAYGFMQRRLSLVQARKIAAQGGVVGLWALALSNPGPAWTQGQGGWTVGHGDTLAYARELAGLVGRIGADHVALGTDIEGVGPRWAVDDYTGVRRVIDHLQDMKLPAGTVEKLAGGNYARVLKEALAV